MKHIVTVPVSYPAERDYILSVILKEFLGLDYIVRRTGNADVFISDQDSKRCLIIPDGLFAIPKEQWLTQKSLPKQPLEVWDPHTMGFGNNIGLTPVPIIYGTRNRSVDEIDFFQNDQDLYLPIDIFGSAFFMLTRYEEIVRQDRDVHDRFPAWASLAYQEGFLERPIIDEYVEILWLAMKRVWPGLKRKPSQPRKLISCDVDCAYSQNVKSLRMTLKNMAGDLIKRKSTVNALRTGLNTFCSSFGYYRFDPINTFDWIMDVNERAGNSVAFYFLADHLVDEMGGCYSIQESRIRALMRLIHAHGHEIGMHGSYNSFQNFNQIMKERTDLLQVCKSLAIDPKTIVGNRQHYLRWDATQTPDHLNTAGFEYDTSGSFADSPGFRYGTSHPFAMWSWQKNAPLNIKQRPLVLMEGSVIADSYLALGYTDEALDLMLTLKKRALQFGGDFTLLWHNSHFMINKDREFYKVLIK